MQKDNSIKPFLKVIKRYLDVMTSEEIEHFRNTFEIPTEVCTRYKENRKMLRDLRDMNKC